MKHRPFIIVAFFYISKARFVRESLNVALRMLFQFMKGNRAIKIDFLLFLPKNYILGCQLIFLDIFFLKSTIDNGLKSKYGS